MMRASPFWSAQLAGVGEGATVSSKRWCASVTALRSIRRRDLPPSTVFDAGAGTGDAPDGEGACVEFGGGPGGPAGEGAGGLYTATSFMVVKTMPQREDARRKTP